MQEQIVNQEGKPIAIQIIELMKEEFNRKLRGNKRSSWKMNIFLDLEKLRFYYDDILVDPEDVDFLVSLGVIRYTGISTHQGMKCAKYTYNKQQL